jgi:uncharacterized ferritin-like protein (DUF455 family)
MRTPKKIPPAERRLRLIHAQAHIESYAIDLSWDILLRFGSRPDLRLPLEFYFDWLKVAVDEAKHFMIWHNRLLDLGSFYGAFPTHDGLWQSAYDTKDSFLGRLAIVHLVHEAHGLDVSQRLCNKFIGGGDMKSAGFFKDIEVDEATHVKAGLRWFKYACAHPPVTTAEDTGPAEPLDPIPTFHTMVKQVSRLCSVIGLLSIE